MKIFDVTLNPDQSCDVRNCLEGTDIKLETTQECNRYILNYLLDAWNVLDPDHAHEIKSYLDEWEEELLVYKTAEIKLERVQ